MFWDEVCDHLFNAIFTVPPKIQLFIREANSRIVSSVNFQCFHQHTLDDRIHHPTTFLLYSYILMYRTYASIQAPQPKEVMGIL